MIDRNPPSNWKVEKFADVGASEPFVNQFLELFDILGTTLIRKAEKERVENAIGTVLTDGLMPTFLELRSIRALLRCNGHHFRHRRLEFFHRHLFLLPLLHKQFMTIKSQNH